MRNINVGDYVRRHGNQDDHNTYCDYKVLEVGGKYARLELTRKVVKGSPCYTLLGTCEIQPISSLGPIPIYPFRELVQCRVDYATEAEAIEAAQRLHPGLPILRATQRCYEADLWRDGSWHRISERAYIALRAEVGRVEVYRLRGTRGDPCTWRLDVDPARKHQEAAR